MSVLTLTRTPFELMDRTMNDLTKELSRTFNWPNREESLIPNLDIAEDNENFYIIAELPGVEDKDLKVTVDEGTLTIQGQKEEKSEKKDRNYYHSERKFGQFLRATSLPTHILENQIIANFANGLLEVTIPKDVKAKPSVREIPLTNGEKRAMLNKPVAINNSK